MRRVVTLAEAATIVGLSKPQVHKLAVAGTLPTETCECGRRVFPVIDLAVIAWLRSRGHRMRWEQVIAAKDAPSSIDRSAAAG